MTEIDIFGIEPHPAADAFPMMEEEELEELGDFLERYYLCLALPIRLSLISQLTQS